jgi:hypothetical protein
MYTNVKKETTFISNGNMTLGVGDPLTGVLNIKTGDYTYIEGDLSVSGGITGLAVTSQTKVNAETGVTAGPLGFVTESGGVSVGIPASSPIGTINASLAINAGLSVNAPFINGGMVRDSAGTMLGMRTVYNSHVHPAPRGITGTPISPMTLL